jgi:hypothetical protein
MIVKSAAAATILAFLVSVPALLAQDKPQPEKAPIKLAAAPAKPDEQNLDAYIKLLRKDVRSQKSAVMKLSKVNDLRIANIKEYANSYNQLTDAKADELVGNAMAYQKQRTELLAKYYERMKQEMGAITAARFVQVEYQLLLIIDLQIDSALPIVGS